MGSSLDAEHWYPGSGSEGLTACVLHFIGSNPVIELGTGTSGPLIMIIIEVPTLEGRTCGGQCRGNEQYNHHFN